ncbi:MAG: RNA polymerase sigma factor [Betaproteobacteria bacterium]|nr:RNA polymerase sigma factor [Betaproteobacteria bacterium]NBO45237.1 RNA polymerase sigma factor [Betaproteobacteria bacterium]NBP09835.1 RNA polymerase sigma factor [Betaproteobacteria bacterium]NBP61104.1 RNA polymerase sigma factor [Betaproteobacteria bacterium]NBQ09818.1 RNA polymerase sigma factor [Betaproteobacteria bacterium]
MSDDRSRIRQELDAFLAAVEQRAFKTAVYAVRDEQLALDIVQDSMMKLAQHYSQSPSAEWPLLFQRVLQNTIRDHFRRARVRNLWVSLVGNLRAPGDPDDDEALSEGALLDGLAAQSGHVAESAESTVNRQQSLDLIERALEKLPLRQREAFLLRYWEGLDVQETALVMGCSEGSVKTHCSRAVHSLSVLLQALKR